jgi:3-phosphoshikimate 1-carboxyvinyltransferase
MLAQFGIKVEREGFQRFTLPAGSAYRTPGDVHVEGDASSASYFIALGALAARPGAPVRIEGVGAASIQGDIRFVEAAQAMGATVRSGPNWLEVERGTWPLKALQLDCNHIPDAAMTLAVMALYADGPTRLTNIASWRVKETDRIAAMAAELRKTGAHVIEGPDFIDVTPPVQWRAAAVHTYDDHRMAMCLSLAAFNPLALASTPGVAVPVRILEPACVAKTFPDYFEALFSLARAGAGRGHRSRRSAGRGGPAALHLGHHGPAQGGDADQRRHGSHRATGAVLGHGPRQREPGGDADVPHWRMWLWHQRDDGGRSHGFDARSQHGEDH